MGKLSKQKPGTLSVSFELLQNGTSIASTQKKWAHTGDVEISNHSRGSLVVPNYPLTGDIRVVTSRKGKTYVTLDRGWDGFIVSNGEVIELDPHDRTPREIPIQKGDYASLSIDDLRLLIKVAPAKSAPATKRDTSLSGSLFDLFITDKTDVAALAGGLALAVIMFGIFAGVLKTTKDKRPTEFSQLGDAYTLAFINPDHLRNTPEALQSSLDRSKFLGSTTSYYRSLSQMLLGQPIEKENMLFPTSADRWSNAWQTRNDRLSEKIEKQQKIEEAELSRLGSGVLAVPSVTVEPAEVASLRLLDKLEIHNQSMVDQLDLRRSMTKSFPKDQPYDFNEYRNLGKARSLVSDATREALAKIRPFEELTDEEAMYALGERLALKSQVLRANIFGNTTERLSADDLTIIEMPSGVEFASFIAGIDYILSDEKYFKIEAVEFGQSPKQRKARGEIPPREPLIGVIEPALIEKTIEKHRFELQLCFELALRRNNLARGVMEWKWRIDSRGQISDISLISSTIQDRTMTDCIREKMAKWRFPRPRRGSVEVSYPFEFSPKRG